MSFLFLVFVLLAFFSSIAVVLRKNPVASALSLILTLFSFAGIYALLSAHFLAAMQILVYTGAIMVLFVFVIMLLNADKPVVDLNKTPLIAKVLSFLGVAFIASALIRVVSSSSTIIPTGVWTDTKINVSGGNTFVISSAIFSDYLFVFEWTSFLLLSGIVATIALAKRNRGAE